MNKTKDVSLLVKSEDGDMNFLHSNLYTQEEKEPYVESNSKRCTRLYA